MNMIEVTSSSVWMVGYDESHQTMVVLFNRGIFVSYYDVPKKVYEGLLEADSKGSYIGYAVDGFFPEDRGKPRWL